MQMPSLYKKYHYLPKRDQKQFFAFPEKLGNDQIPFFFAKLPTIIQPAYFDFFVGSKMMIRNLSLTFRKKNAFTLGV